MNTSLRNNKDFLSGLLLIAIGLGAFLMALDYPFGSSRAMGPGYFPRVLAVIAIGFGVVLLVKGLRTCEAVKGLWGWRPLAWITISLFAFGGIMDRFGIVPALVALFFIGAFAGHEFKWKEVTLLTIIMTIFAVVVFVTGLGLPYPLIQGF